MRKAIVCFAVGCVTATAFAEGLPGFQTFRAIDRERRVTHQLLTPALVAAMRVDPALLKSTVEKQPDDARLLLGAAELATEWAAKREYYEAALRAAGTNAVVALRYALAAASRREFETALTWLRFCETQDKQNTAAWLAEVWVLGQQEKAFKMPAVFAAAKFDDYSVDATRARVVALDKMGYSAYAARRIGVSADSPVMMMARDLGRAPVSKEAEPVLKAAGTAMQKAPTFLLTELVGQSLESAVSQSRMTQMEQRRDDVKELVAAMEQGVVEYATESEMVQYYDKMLSDGEEAAMKWLSHAVNRQPSKQ